MLIFILALLILGQLIIGSLLLLESRRTGRVDQLLFAIICFLLIAWTVASGLLTGVDTAVDVQNKSLYITANLIAYFLSCVLIILVYVFSLFYPFKSKIKWWQTVILAFGVIVALLSPLPAVSGSFSVVGGDLIYKYGALSPLLVILTFAALVAIYATQGYTLRHTQDTGLHKQVKTLLAGIALTTVHILVFVVLLPGIFGQHPVLYAIGYAGSYYLVAFAGYGLLRQGLFDIRAIVARSAAYVVSILLVSFGYVSLVVFLSSYLLDVTLSVATLWILALTTLVVAYLFQPVKAFFNKITNKFFYRDFYDAQDVLYRLSNVLVGTVDVDQIRRKSLTILRDAVKPTKVKFLLFTEPEKTPLSRMLKASASKLIAIDEIDRQHFADLYTALHDEDITLAVRLRTTHEDLGYLLLGLRRSGTGYSSADRKFLSVASDEVAIALQNALRFEEIKNFNLTLQHRIDEATKQLRQQNQRLRVLDQTKDDFISMASHQLRTPLTSVKGYISMVLDGDAGKITDTQRKLLNQSFVSSQRMVYLISDLLNVSRLRTGKFVIEPVASNLAEVIEDEVGQLQETAKSRELTLSYQKPEHFPTLMLDENKLRQVIMNFIDNAIYYTPSGGHITINLVDKPQAVEFTVVDDGIGVPKNEQHHLFTKFYRAHNAKRARPDGTGLGLFMAKKVIIAQGGATIFRSQENKGSTFGFTFPKHKLAAKPEAQQATEASKPADPAKK